MKIRNSPKFGFAVFLATTAMVSSLSAQSKAPRPFDVVIDDPKLPRVLLIGDSISIGYTVEVRNLLAGQANVHRPKENCASTKQGLEKIDKWLGDKRWDVIHFNWGLHDLKYINERGRLGDPKDPKFNQQVPVEQYRKNLKKLVIRMEKSAEVLIWRSTTPVPEEGANGRIPGDSRIYNQVAHEVMQKLPKIQTDDLFAFVKPNQNQWKSSKGNVHFTKDANLKLAGKVAEAIKAALPPAPESGR